MTGLVAHIVGARPNFMKASPVIDALSAHSVGQTLIHTGQHYDQRMSDIFFDELGMRRPDVNLGIGSGSHAVQTAALLTGLEPVMLAERPALVLVYGDVNSTLAGALVAAKLGIAFAHVEAGLRSFDRTMPEEINRVLIDAIADLHFVTSQEAVANLTSEGVSEQQIHPVGNTMIDTLLRHRDRLDAAGAARSHGMEGDFGVVTLHRPANVDDPAAAARVVGALTRAAAVMPLILPLHPRGLETLVQAGLKQTDRIRITEPLGYLEFMSLVAAARVVITDSGGVQEESSVLGVPCLTMRPNTERLVTITHGTNRLVDPDPDTVEQAVLAAMESDREPAQIPLWDGKAGERIASVIVAHLGGTPGPSSETRQRFR